MIEASQSQPKFEMHSLQCACAHVKTDMIQSVAAVNDPFPAAGPTGKDVGKTETRMKYMQQYNTRLPDCNEILARTKVEIFFLSLTFMSGWETMGLNLYSVFLNGGPAALTWGTIVVISGASAQAASLAEMSSIKPVAGAQYHWTFLFAPEKCRLFITWMQGWITWFAWISTMAGIANTTASNLQSIIIMNYPGYVAQRYHVTLIIVSLIVTMGFLNIHAYRIIPWVELMSGILHIVLFVIYTVVLLSLSERHTSEWVWFGRTDGAASSGWSNGFVSWNLGMLMPTWGFVGFDAAVHLGEEVRKAKLAVPRVMFWTVVLNGVLAFAFALVILYCAGDTVAALAARSGQPFLYICESVTGSTRVATAMGCGLLLISTSVTLASIASVSRLTWAWARDGALPEMFAHVSEKHRVPVNAILLSGFFVIVLGILNVPSTAAFGAIIALASLGLYTSYFIAIGCMLHARIWDPIVLGAWNLGRWGFFVNIFALLYTTWIIFWLPFPTRLPVTGAGMNYALPIFLFVVLVMLGLWGFRRRTWSGVNVAVMEEAVKEE